MLIHSRAPGSRRKRADSVFEDLLGGAIQNALQRNCPTQPGSGCMTFFGNPEALGFLVVQMFHSIRS